MERLGHGVGVDRVLLGVELVVVALDEHGTAPARGDGTREHAGDVLAGPLVGVFLLASCQLEDDGSRVEGRRRLRDDACHVEHLGPDVDGRHREPVYLAPAPGHVQVVDACGWRAELL